MSPIHVVFPFCYENVLREIDIKLGACISNLQGHAVITLTLPEASISILKNLVAKHIVPDLTKTGHKCEVFLIISHVNKDECSTVL
jgi:hypothetical protein